MLPNKPNRKKDKDPNKKKGGKKKKLDKDTQREQAEAAAKNVSTMRHAKKFTAQDLQELQELEDAEREKELHKAMKVDPEQLRQMQAEQDMPGADTTINEIEDWAGRDNNDQQQQRRVSILEDQGMPGADATIDEIEDWATKDNNEQKNKPKPKGPEFNL